MLVLLLLPPLLRPLLRYATTTALLRYCTAPTTHSSHLASLRYADEDEQWAGALLPYTYLCVPMLDSLGPHLPLLRPHLPILMPHMPRLAVHIKRFARSVLVLLPVLTLTLPPP